MVVDRNQRKRKLGGTFETTSQNIKTKHWGGGLFRLKNSKTCIHH